MPPARDHDRAAAARTLLAWGAIAGSAGCAQLWNFQPLTETETARDAGSDAGSSDAAGAPDTADAANDVTQDAPAADGGATRCPAPPCQIVLMGGDDGAAFGDTWLWDGSHWTQADPAATPPARTESAAATLEGDVVLFGGRPSTFSTVPENDTWTWEGTTWAQGIPASPPPARVSPSMAAFGGGIVLFGGATFSATASLSNLQDTWLWNGSNWTLASPAVAPSPRSGAAVGDLGGVLWLFGGTDSTVAFDDTWKWDGSSWAEVKVAGPPARSNAASAVLEGKLVVFGGIGDTTSLGDTWEWDGAAWNQLMVSGPTARYSAAAATLGQKMVLFGGFDLESATSLADTWTWDGSTWKNLPVKGPAGRGNAAMSGP